MQAEDVRKLLAALEQLLHDADSFVYMNALLAVRELGAASTRLVFEWLLDAFAAMQDDQAAASGAAAATAAYHRSYTSQSSECSDAILSLPRRRAMLAEAMMLMLRSITSAAAARRLNRGAASTVWHPLISQVQQLILVSVKLARTRPAALADMDALVNLQSMRMTLPSAHASSEYGEKCSSLQQEAAVVEETSEAADGIILRQSAVSLLAEAVAVMPDSWAIGDSVLADIVDIGAGMLMLEAAYTQSSRAARRYYSFSLPVYLTCICIPLAEIA